MRIRERLTGEDFVFTNSEKKVVRELLNNYPSAALVSASHLARCAGVSDPTVVRLANKLGYERFADMQQALRDEVASHLNSPMTMLSSSGKSLDGRNVWQGYLQSVTHDLTVMAQEILPAQFDDAVDLISDPKLRLSCLGGRVSGFLAAMLQWHLQQIRPGVQLLTHDRSQLADRLVDFGKRDLLVVYDIRRYEVDVVQFAEAAARRGAQIILFTDRWRSPIARCATIVFSAPVETVSPFDTMTPLLALMEALIAAVARKLGDSFAERMERIEAARAPYNITVDQKPASAVPTNRRGRKPRDGQ